MRTNKAISILFATGIFFFTLSSPEILAQDSKPIFVSEIRFEGMKNVSNQELVEDFHKCWGSEPSIFDERHYEYCVQKSSRSLMFSHGFFEAKIRRVAPHLVNDSYIVRIEVEEGIRYRIGEIKVEGEKAFSKKEILAMIGQKFGEIANGRDLQDAVYDRLKRAYEEKGYVQNSAQFEPIFFEPPSPGLDGKVDMLITIDEGMKFSVRRISFSGVEKEDEKLLRKNFLLKSGDLFVRSKFEASVEDINNSKLFNHLDIDSDVEFRTDEESAEIDLVVKLKRIH